MRFREQEVKLFGKRYTERVLDLTETDPFYFEHELELIE